jgi:hypothetical protein
MTALRVTMGLAAGLAASRASSHSRDAKNEIEQSISILAAFLRIKLLV